MKTQSLTWSVEPAIEFEIQLAPRSSQPPRLESRHLHGGLRVPLPLPRRASCLNRRAMLAALREAELAAWQNSGGDYLHQAVR